MLQTLCTTCTICGSLFIACRHQAHSDENTIQEHWGHLICHCVMVLFKSAPAFKLGEFHQGCNLSYLSRNDKTGSLYWTCYAYIFHAGWLHFICCCIIHSLSFLYNSDRMFLKEFVDLFLEGLRHLK